VPDRRYNAKLILPDGTEKPSLIVYYPPTLTGEEVEDIGREILAVFTGRVLSDVEDEEGRGTTTEDMLDAGLLDADGVKGCQCEYNGGTCARAAACSDGCQAMRMVRERRAAADAAERNAGVEEEDRG
jgi:hypothetical protein